MSQQMSMSQPKATIEYNSDHTSIDALTQKLKIQVMMLSLKKLI